MWCFSCLQWISEDLMRWMANIEDGKVFFMEIDTTFVLFLKDTAVKWCIAFVYLCNIVHVYFFYLCYCLWITEPCPWISDSLISIKSKCKKSWISQDDTGFDLCPVVFFPSPPCRSECFIWLMKRPHSRKVVWLH